jgi:hypothetical protein
MDSRSGAGPAVRRPAPWRAWLALVLAALAVVIFVATVALAIETGRTAAQRDMMAIYSVIMVAGLGLGVLLAIAAALLGWSYRRRETGSTRTRKLATASALVSCALLVCVLPAVLLTLPKSFDYEGTWIPTDPGASLARVVVYDQSNPEGDEVYIASCYLKGSGADDALNFDEGWREGRVVDFVNGPEGYRLRIDAGGDGDVLHVDLTHRGEVTAEDFTRR